MIDLAEILNKSYSYTKNHKFLWFFGFFLTGWGTLNFIRHVDLNPSALYLKFSYFGASVGDRPVILILTLIGSVLLIFGMTMLGAIARSVIIYTGLHVERKEEITANLALKHTQKALWRVFWVGVLTGLTMFAILSWLSFPLYLVFRNAGDQTSSIFLALIALAIFVPVIIILSLVNIFSACYIVVYDFKVLPAIKGSFDLLAGFWGKTMSLFTILFVVYVALFFFSATILGLFGFLAYGLSLLFKNLPASALSGILLLIISLFSFLLIFVNAVLNVFTNFAWTLFFLKIVKAKLIKESEAVPTIA
jgi:hypothetical protein